MLNSQRNGCSTFLSIQRHFNMFFPHQDEFHTRLRFVRRGLVAMANAGPNDNGSQFFFTLGQTPELQGKHTIFGKITGNTLYNLPRFEEGIINKVLFYLYFLSLLAFYYSKGSSARTLKDPLITVSVKRKIVVSEERINSSCILQHLISLSF